MNANSFNICPGCVHMYSCVLTSLKSQVWSCSEFEEGIKAKTQPKPECLPERQLEMANH